VLCCWFDDGQGVGGVGERRNSAKQLSPDGGTSALAQKNPTHANRFADLNNDIPTPSNGSKSEFFPCMVDPPSYIAAKTMDPRLQRLLTKRGGIVAAPEVSFTSLENDVDASPSLACL